MEKHARVAHGGAVHLVDERGYPVCGSGQSSHAHNFRSRRARIHTSDPLTCKKCLKFEQGKQEEKKVVNDNKQLIMSAYRRDNPSCYVSWYARPDSTWLYPEETCIGNLNLGSDADALLGVVREENPRPLDRNTNQWSPEAFYEPMWEGSEIAQRIKLHLGRQTNSLDWKGTEEQCKPLLCWQLCADTVLLAFGPDYWGKRTDSDMIGIDVLFKSLKALRADLLKTQPA